MKSTRFARTLIFVGSFLLQLSALCFQSHGAAGDVDLSFYSDLGPDGRVNAIVVQPDGKVFIGGTRMTVAGFVYLQAIVRLNADGSPDTTFAVDQANGWFTDVSTIVLLPDGKVLVGYNNGISRLNSDGSPDSSFIQPGITNDDVFTGVSSIVVQSDGKLLIGGLFKRINNTRRDGIARLNANGTLDSSFYPGSGVTSPFSMYPAVAAMAVQSDGKVLIGGNFVYVNDIPRIGIARLNADGSLDSSFDPGISDLEVASLALQPNGKVLIGGTFNNVNGVSRNSIARLNGDGSVDSSFDPGSGLDGGSASALVLQPDHKALVVGDFLTVNGTNRNRIARFNPDGGLDTTFEPGSGPHPYIWALAVQSDGKVIFGGSDIAGNVADDKLLIRLHGDTAAPSGFTNLHSFAGWPDEGASPVGDLLLSGNILYGTAGGGSNGYGSIFKVNADGTGFTNLYSFTATSGGNINSDGAAPRAGLVLSGDILYGTASLGGSHGHGTVFAINTGGTGFTNLHSFNGFDGMNPVASLVLSGATLYGTTRGDGENVFGTVFAINTDGTGLTNLHTFGGDGTSPLAGLVLSGNTLYGTTQGGGGPGGAGVGMVFAVNTDGSGFTNIHAFTGFANGGGPHGGLILAGDTLYGTTFGDYLGNPEPTPSTVFKVNTNGTGFTILHTFNVDFSDGFFPTAGLVLSGGTLYGTTSAGGSPMSGTVFTINTDGTGFSTLYDFTALPDAGGPPYTNSDGAYPSGDLILAGNTLYGTASQGGSFGAGTVFSLSLPPRSFAGWAASFGLSGGDAAAGADPDKDGLANATEYVFGSDPSVASASGHPIATTSSGNMLFTFLRDDTSETPDVTLTFESGTDLVSWPTVFSIGPDSASSSPGVTITENGTAPDTITVAIPVGAGKAKFARLKVTIAP